MVKPLLFFLQIILVSNAVPLTVRRNGSGSSFSYIGSYKGQETKARSVNAADYYVSTNPASWVNALQDCRHVFGPDAHMVTIETPGEWQFLKEHLENYSGTRYWTSASFDTTSNVWRWANSQPLPNSAPWLRGYPNNPTSNLRVLIYRTNQFDPAWRTEDYTRMERYICEVPARQILSDGSGLYNYNTDDIASPCDLFKQENWV